MPLPNDKVFNFRGIAMSAFCEATVQTAPFVACGRAGNGLVVLEPRVLMKPSELAYFAAYINQALRWRFNWYRQITADRIRTLALPDAAPSDLVFSVTASMPPLDGGQRGHAGSRISGDFRSRRSLTSKADIITRSTAYSPELFRWFRAEIRIMELRGYFDVDRTYQNRLTIALNGSTLATKYHPYLFAAKDRCSCVHSTGTH